MGCKQALQSCGPLPCPTRWNFQNLVRDFAFERRESEANGGGLVRRLGESTTEGLPQEHVSEPRRVASLIYRFGGDGGDPLN